MTSNEYHGTPRIDIVRRLRMNADVVEGHGYPMAALTMREGAAIIEVLRTGITADQLDRLASIVLDNNECNDGRSERPDPPDPGKGFTEYTHDWRWWR